MAGLRLRTPFHFDSDSKEAQVPEILDDQEQEEIIQEFRTAQIASHESYLLGARIVLVLSAVLHLHYLVSSSKRSPLFVIFPSKDQEPEGVPGIIFASLSVMLHLALFLRCTYAESSVFLPPVIVTFGLGTLAPMLTLLRGCLWQTVIWWCTTPAMACLVLLLDRWSQQGKEEIIALEQMKYHVSGA